MPTLPWVLHDDTNVQVYTDSSLIGLRQYCSLLSPLSVAAFHLDVGKVDALCGLPDAAVRGRVSCETGNLTLAVDGAAEGKVGGVENTAGGLVGETDLGVSLPVGLTE